MINVPMIEIRGQNVIIDVREEIEAFEWGSDARWSHDKLIARSPFREDSHPSFFVRLEPYQDYPAGIWYDSGAYGTGYEKGGLTRLLSFLRHEDESETEEYLLDKYAPTEGPRKLVPPQLRKDVWYATLPADTIEVMPSPYLTKRGITEEAQLKAGTGRSQHKGYVALPWHFPDGRLANVKYRSTKGKSFFYEKDGWPIGSLVWGANSVEPCDILIVCEAEIDALSWRSVGYQAVATGFGSISDEQAEIILALPFKYVLAAGDNDSIGKRFSKRVKRVLEGRAQVSTFDYYGNPQKDANDFLTSGNAHKLQVLVDMAVFPKRFKKISFK